MLLENVDPDGILSNLTEAGPIASANRVNVIARTVAVLERLAALNREREAQVKELRATLKGLKDGNGKTPALANGSNTAPASLQQFPQQQQQQQFPQQQQQQQGGGGAGGQCMMMVPMLVSADRSMAIPHPGSQPMNMMGGTASQATQPMTNPQMMPMMAAGSLQGGMMPMGNGGMPMMMMMPQNNMMAPVGGHPLQQQVQQNQQQQVDSVSGSSQPQGQQAQAMNGVGNHSSSMSNQMNMMSMMMVNGSSQVATMPPQQSLNYNNHTLPQHQVSVENDNKRLKAGDGDTSKGPSQK